MTFQRYILSPSKSAYYHLWIAAAKDQQFFESNIDKAFFIMMIQDYLSPRAGLNEIRPGSTNFSSQVDLIAYSLTDFGVNLLICSTTAESANSFGQTLLLRYAEYLQDQQSWEVVPFDTIFVHDRLADEHEALSISREIHLLHDDWRNDRYSSIGFYLNDRRGDWMQPWHLTDLFDNDAIWYQNFLMDDTGPVEIESLEFLET